MYNKNKLGLVKCVESIRGVYVPINCVSEYNKKTSGHDNYDYIDKSRVKSHFYCMETEIYGEQKFFCHSFFPSLRGWVKQKKPCNNMIRSTYMIIKEARGQI